MSAFQCSERHINTLVHYASAHRVIYSWGPGRIHVAGNESRTALVLQAANARSVNARYAHNPEACVDDEPINFRGVGVLPKAVALLKLANCFAYQACEVSDWEQSEAFAFLAALKERAIRDLPGYDDASWSI